MRTFESNRCLVMCVIATGALASCEKALDEVPPSPAIRQSPPPASIEPADGTLRFAVAAIVSPASTYEAYEDLLGEIAREIGRPFNFVQRRTYKEVNDLLLSGSVDLAFICSGAFASLPKNAPIEILAVPIVNDRATYQSFIIVQRDSTIESFDDLRSKKFAFTDPLSNTGYYYPLARLNQKGADLAFFSSTIFTGSHDRSISAVHRKLVDGAAVDSLVYEEVVVPGSRYFDRIVVIERSPAFPIPPVVVPRSIPQELKERMQTVLLRLHETPEGRGRLAAIGVDRFTKGDAASYDVIRQLAASARSVAP